MVRAALKPGITWLARKVVGSLSEVAVEDGAVDELTLVVNLHAAGVSGDLAVTLGDDLVVHTVAEFLECRPSWRSSAMNSSPALLVLSEQLFLGERSAMASILV